MIKKVDFNNKCYTPYVFLKHIKSKLNIYLIPNIQTIEYDIQRSSIEKNHINHVENFLSFFDY
jgi:hypothetical protein